MHPTTTQVLQKCLWGNYYLQPKSQKILKEPLNDNQKPLFVDFIAKNLWSIYEAHENKDTEKLLKISKSLGIEASSTASVKLYALTRVGPAE